MLIAIVVIAVVAGFLVLVAVPIIAIAWTHRPISVWEMIKEFIAELRDGSGKE